MGLKSNDVSRKTHFNAFTALQVLKGRIVAEWLEARGFDTFLEERRFGAWTRRAEDEPSVALCGVENALARTALEKPGFGLCRGKPGLAGHCFYEGENMLVIHPDECIDCGVCDLECPVDAKPNTEPALEFWLDLNLQYSEV
jgi:NAD-dependent dihydropyrimidine dehydrogenase PreA subunit